jgi:hypothetical protein
LIKSKGAVVMDSIRPVMKEDMKYKFNPSLKSKYLISDYFVLSYVAILVPVKIAPLIKLGYNPLYKPIKPSCFNITLTSFNIDDLIFVD